MIQKIMIEGKFTISIFDPQTMWIATLQPYADIKHLEYHIEPSDWKFSDNKQTRQYATEIYNKILKTIDNVKKYQIEYTVLYDLFQKIERQIWEEIETKTFNGTTGRKIYEEKVRNALRFFYNDLFRHLFSIDGNVETSPYYLQPYLLYQILNALNKDSKLNE